MDDLNAMGQVEPNLDVIIAILAQREPVDIEEDPQGPLNWHQAVLLGTIELGQVPQDNGQVGQVVLRPIREQHDHIMAANLHTHVQDGLLASPNIE